MTLTAFTPEIVLAGENNALARFFKYVQDTVWSQSDLIDWLLDVSDLSDYEAEYYSDTLIDYMLENDLGCEYGGITPWCGEGYSLYSDCFFS
jgi:hypothetical protein